MKDETEPERRLKLQSFLDHLADKKAVESKDSRTPEGSVLPDGKSVRVENGEIVIGGNEKSPEKFDSSRLSMKVSDDAKRLPQFKKIEPFLKSFFREGIPLSKESFDEISTRLSYSLQALSDELEPTIVRKSAGNAVNDTRNINLYDPNSKDSVAVEFRKTVAELNKKYFDDKPSPFRMRP